jgi:hypothetical protein
MSKPGFFTRTYNSLVQARQLEANRQVNAILQMYSDADLKKMGVSRNNLNGNSSNFPL